MQKLLLIILILTVPIITIANDESLKPVKPDEADVRLECARSTIKSNEAEINIFEVQTTMDLYFNMSEVLDLRIKLLTLEAQQIIADGGGLDKLIPIATTVEQHSKDINDLYKSYIGLQARDEVWTGDKALIDATLTELSCAELTLESSDFETACTMFDSELHNAFNCRAIRTGKKLEVENKKKNGSSDPF